MKAHPTAVSAVLLIEPLVHEDERRVFRETWSPYAFDAPAACVRILQDNQSVSVANTMRGLHYQVRKQQGKLVRVNRRRFSMS